MANRCRSVVTDWPSSWNLLSRFASDSRLVHMVQTNATLITDDWYELFAEYAISVGVSIDGPRSMNRNRLDRRGAPVFERILAGIDTLKRCDIPSTVIAVVDQASTGGVSGVTFEGCDLPGGHMSRCQLRDVEFVGGGYHEFDFRHTDLSTIRGAVNLEGAVVSPGQRHELAEALVSELDLHYLDEGDR